MSYRRIRRFFLEAHKASGLDIPYDETGTQWDVLVRKLSSKMSTFVDIEKAFEWWETSYNDGLSLNTVQRFCAMHDCMEQMSIDLRTYEALRKIFIRAAVALGGD